MTDLDEYRCERNVAVRMRDGVLLRVDVYRGSASPRPVLLVSTPYGKSPILASQPGLMSLVTEGFALVCADSRGRFESGGQWQGLPGTADGCDGHDLVEWVAGQPWCDGQVIMTGVSAPGGIAWLTAAERPPHLVAIAPWQYAGGEYDQEETGGAFRLDLFLPWTVAMLTLASSPAPTRSQADLALLEAEIADPLPSLWELPLENHPVFGVAGVPYSFAELVRAGGERLAPVPLPDVRIDDLAVPVHLSSGWFDLYAGSTVRMFQVLQERGGDENVRGQHRLVMGPWTHGTWANQIGEVNSGLLAGPAILESSFRSFVHGCVSDQDSDGDSVAYFLMQANTWRTASCWPPEGAEPTHWYLDSGGRANSAAGDGSLGRELRMGAAASDTFVYDPARPVMTHGGKTIGGGGCPAGPVNQAPTETRDDVLCYTSEEFDEATDVIGPVTLVLWAASSAVDTDFVARLCDVFPDGRSLNICEGVRRSRFRSGYARELPLRPGEAEEFLIDLGHAAWRLGRGHRLRLQITSSNFPHFDRNLNTGGELGREQAWVRAEQTIFHDDARRSHLILSVATRG